GSVRVLAGWAPDGGREVGAGLGPRGAVRVLAGWACDGGGEGGGWPGWAVTGDWRRMAGLGGHR
ncbi:hypothetical protein, partial [Streptomonospora sp. PA3]|uniref:hypothetical protein n=1 Tax=Streptomonospora sp. PA3 TaxID=2607326 RepID=UPI001CA436F9